MFRVIMDYKISQLLTAQPESQQSKPPNLKIFFRYGCFQKQWYPKMDGENNGKPYFLMDDLGGKPIIFGNTNIFQLLLLS